jgi:hypothetical protein
MQKYIWTLPVLPIGVVKLTPEVEIEGRKHG